MRTRRDQVQAYRFVTRRIVSAMVSGEPETNDLPMRRLGLALVGSVLVGALVLAVFGVYGLLVENRAPLANDTLVIEKETGATYVYTADQLYPVPNYSSARLVLNTETPEIRRVSAASLKELPRGRMVGILNAPDSLPDAKSMAGPQWRVCSAQPEPRASGARGVLVIGRSLPGAEPLGSEGIMAKTDNGLYLLWEGKRLAMPDAVVLGAEAEVDSALPIAEQLIEAIPAGPDLKRPSLPGFGTAFDGLVGGAAAQIGDVFRAGNQNYVLAGDGLSPVGELTASLFLGTGQARSVSEAEAKQLAATTKVEPAGFPRTTPTVSPIDRDTGSALCSFYDAEDGSSTIEVYRVHPKELDEASETRAEPAKDDNGKLADRILIGGGQAAMAQTAQADGKPAQGSTVYLITADGRKYPLGVNGGDARTALGYGAVTPVPVSAALLELVATGPTLDVEAAQKFLNTTGANGQ